MVDLWYLNPLGLLVLLILAVTLIITGIRRIERQREVRCAFLFRGARTYADSTAVIARARECTYVLPGAPR